MSLASEAPFVDRPRGDLNRPCHSFGGSVRIGAPFDMEEVMLVVFSQEKMMDSCK